LLFRVDRTLGRDIEGNEPGFGIEIGCLSPADLAMHLE